LTNQWDDRGGINILKAGVVYFALVFGAGFVIGFIRTMWVAPRLGTRMAEWLEIPIMLVVTIVAARWSVQRVAVSFTLSTRLGSGRERRCRRRKPAPARKESSTIS